MSTNRGLYRAIAGLLDCSRAQHCFEAAAVVVINNPQSSIILLKGHFISLIEFPVRLSFSLHQPRVKSS